MESEGRLLYNELRVASDIEHISPGTAPAENQVRSIVGDEKSEPPAEINSKVSGIDKMIAGHQSVLEVKNFIRGTEYFCYFGKVRRSFLNKSYLVLGNRLVNRQALPYDGPTACDCYERKANYKRADDVSHYCAIH